MRVGPVRPMGESGALEPFIQKGIPFPEWSRSGVARRPPPKPAFRKDVGNENPDLNRGDSMPIDLVGLLAVFSILFVPMTGLMLILTTRFAFKPLVETLARALRESGHSRSESSAFSNQVLLEELESLRDEVRELKSMQEFDRKLLESPRQEEEIPV